MVSSIIKRSWIAVLALTLMTGAAYAGGAWFDSFDRGTVNESQANFEAASDPLKAGSEGHWYGLDGKNKGTLDSSTRIGTKGQSLRIDRNSRPARKLGYHPTGSPGGKMVPEGVVSVWVYDDGETPKAFDVVVRGDNRTGSEAETTFGITHYAALGLRAGDYYTYNLNGTVEATSIPRSVGWHLFQFTVDKNDGTTLIIDGQLVGSPSPYADLTRPYELHVDTEFGDPGDMNVLWIDSVRYFWEFDYVVPKTPTPAFVALVDDFDLSTGGASHWGAPGFEKVAPSAPAANLSGNMNIPNVPWGIAEPAPANAIDLNAHAPGDRAAVGDYYGIVPFTGNYRLGFHWFNGEGQQISSDPVAYGNHSRYWPNLTVTTTGEGMANLGFDEKQHLFSFSETSLFEVTKGDDFSILITGDPTATPWTEGGTGEQGKFCRFDRFILIMDEFRYQLEYSIGFAGTLVGDTAQGVLPGQDGATVEVVPHPGNIFLHWSDGVTDNPRTDLAVNGHVNVEAIFEPPLDARSWTLYE